MNKLRKYIVILGCFICAVAFAAKTPDPMIMLHSISDQMITSLKQNRPKLQKDPAYIYKLVNKILVPQADMEGMTRSALGRNAWLSASASARAAFTKEFKNILIGTYASALNAYTDETIKFDPIRGGYEGETRLQVDSQVLRRDGPPIPVSYRLVLKNGQWKVYDLSVEGVSMLQSFRSQFASELSQGKSVSAIVQELKQRNQRNRTG